MCNQKSRLLIIGAGGHGRVAAEIAEAMTRYGEIAFLDDGIPSAAMRHPLLGDCSCAPHYADTHEFFVAIGSNSVRQRITEGIHSFGGKIATLIHPTAIISPSAEIGCGSIAMPGAIVNANAKIGESTILNTHCSVDHDCCIDSFCHISVDAHLCGSVSLGRLCFIGAGAVIINNVDLCSGCTIGAGSVVLKDISLPGTYVGSPVRKA